MAKPKRNPREKAEAQEVQELAAEVRRMQQIHELIAKRNALVRVLNALKEGRLGS